MKRLVVLLLLVLIVMSVTPSHTSDERYYLYPFIGYVGDSGVLPDGRLTECTIDCTIFFKGVKIQDMTPTSDQHINDDKLTARSFTLSEIFGVEIAYCVRIFVHHSTLYLWNGKLIVDEQTIERIDDDNNSWAQYKCFGVSNDWSMGLYAVASGNVQTSDNEILMVFLLSFGLCFAIIIEKGCRWISEWRKKKNERREERSRREKES